MELGLKGKCVIVTASDSGIGKGCALEFAREGARVMLFARKEDELRKACDEIAAATGNRPGYRVGDMTRPADIQALIESAVKEHGPVWALFANTGGPLAGPFTQFDDKVWQEAFELTLLSYVRLIRGILPVMKANGGGRIVCNTSSSVKQAIENLMLSNVFRPGIVGLCKSLSREHGRDNVLVNAIGAGKIKTGRVDYVDNSKAVKAGVPFADFQKKEAAAIPLQRYGTPEEFGRTVAFLCSAANTYVTGQSFLVDGGMGTAY